MSSELNNKIEKVHSITYGDCIDEKLITQNDNFKKYNIIYGHNRCGKTSISRALNLFKLEDKDSKTSGKFIIENVNVDSSRNTYDNIFVFNTDFINENIASDIDNNHITLSKDMIENNKNIEKTTETIDRLKSELTKFETKVKDFKTLIRDKTISYHDEWKSGNDYNISKLDVNIKNYDKNIIVDIADVQNISKKLKEQINITYTEYLHIKNSNLVTKIDTILQTLEQSIFSVSLLQNKANIDRLSNDPIVANWVKDFFCNIRDNKYSDKSCPFCETEYISNDHKNIHQKPFNIFFQELSEHYNQTYDNFIKKCDEELKTLNNINIDAIINNEKPQAFNLKDNNQEFNQTITNLYSFNKEGGSSFYDSANKIITAIKNIVTDKRDNIANIECKTDYANQLNTLKNDWDLIKKCYTKQLFNINKRLDDHNNFCNTQDTEKQKNRQLIIHYFVGRYIKAYDRTIKPIIDKKNDSINKEQEKLKKFLVKKGELDKKHRNEFIPLLNALLPESLELCFKIENDNDNKIAVYRADKKNELYKIERGREKYYYVLLFFILS